MKRIAPIILLLFASTAWGQNFIGADKIYTDRAEQVRRDIAIFWTGKELPGDWSEPCRMTITVRPRQNGGGSTKFSFDNGEVFGWNMTITGSHENLLNSVIPHEVSHTIFASITRRPVVRWLDEGCASLFELKREHERYRHLAKQDSQSYEIMLKYLEAGSYPRSGTEMIRLYAVSYTFTEWLLNQKGQRKLFEFVSDDGTIRERIQKHYGMTADDALKRWHLWLRDLPVNCSDANCIFHRRTLYAFVAPGAG